MENEEQEVPIEDTRPVSNRNDVRQILDEILKRTEAMEERLERIVAKKLGLYWVADEEETG